MWGEIICKAVEIFLMAISAETSLVTEENTRIKGKTTMVTQYVNPK